MTLKNGQVWKKGEATFAVTQDLGNGLWLLLGGPDRAPHGGTQMGVIPDADGRTAVTMQELAERLDAEGWVLSPGHGYELTGGHPTV